MSIVVTPESKIIIDITAIHIPGIIARANAMVAVTKITKAVFFLLSGKFSMRDS